VNVHLRGKLQDGKWALDRSSFDFYEALDKLRLEWKYEGLLTVEPEGVMNGALFESFLKAMFKERWLWKEIIMFFTHA